MGWHAENERELTGERDFSAGRGANGTFFNGRIGPLRS